MVLIFFCVMTDKESDRNTSWKTYWTTSRKPHVYRKDFIVTTTKQMPPPLPPRPLAPKIAALKAAKGGKATSLPPMPKTPPKAGSGLPPRPTRRSAAKLTAPKRVKNANGEWATEDREIEFLEQDARIIAHLMEFGIANRKHLAYLCGADKRTVDMKLDSLRKRLKLLLEASEVDTGERHPKGQKKEVGLIRTVGSDTGNNTVYELTELGEKFYNGSKLPRRFSSDTSETQPLNVTSVVVRMSGARASSWFKQLAPGKTSVGLPIISRSRIAYDTELMMNSMTDISGIKILDRQMVDADFWRKDPNYPRISSDSFDIADVTADESMRIHHYFRRKRTESNHGRKFSVLPSYVFQIFDDESTALNLMDFVIPMPHLTDRGKPAISALAGFVDHSLPTGELERDVLLQERFLRVANSAVPFSVIACFVPETYDDVYKAIETNWHLLVDHQLINESQRGSLMIIPYDPISTPNTIDDFATPDSNRASSHFARG